MIFIIAGVVILVVVSFFVLSSNKKTTKVNDDNENVNLGEEMLFDIENEIDDKILSLDDDKTLNIDDEIIDLKIPSSESNSKLSEPVKLQDPSFKDGKFKNFMQLTNDEFRDMINYENDYINNNIINSNKDIDMSLVVGKYEILKRMKEIRDNNLNKEFEIIRVKSEHKTDEEKNNYINKIRILMLLSRHNPVGLTMNEIKDNDDKLGMLSTQKLSILLKNLINNCNIQKYTTPVDTFFVYVNSIGYDFGMLKNPNWEDVKVIDKKQETKDEKIEVFELTDLKEELFEDDGVIGKKVNSLLDKYLNIKLKSNLSNSDTNSLLNKLYKEIVSMIKFDDYKKVISSSDVNINLIKGIYLYNLKEFLMEFDDSSKESHVNSYSMIICDIHKNLFMPSDSVDKMSIIRCIGTLKNKMNSDFNIEDIGLKKEDNKYVRKAICVDYLVKNILKNKNEESTFYNGRLNPIKFLDYLSRGIVYFRDDQIEFDGKKREALGIEFNSNAIWLNCDILLDVNTFIRDSLDLIEYIEEDDRFLVNIEDIDESIRNYFGDENLTAYSFVSLFANKYAEFKLSSSLEGFEIKVHPEITEKFPQINQYLEELVNHIFTFNKIPIKNKEINFV